MSTHQRKQTVWEASTLPRRAGPTWRRLRDRTRLAAFPRFPAGKGGGVRRSQARYGM